MKRFIYSCLTLTACGTTVHHNYYTIDPVDPGGPDEGPVVPLEATTTPEAFVAEVYGEDGLVWWINAPRDQIEDMNEAITNGGWWGDDGVYDMDKPSYADSVLIRNLAGEVADFGKVEVHLAGQSTAAQWTPTTIPNFKLDSDEFVEGRTFAGVEHVRLNNGQVGSMLGEPGALAIYKALGVPAARASFAWVGGTGWEDSELLVPMIAREVYRGDFCDAHADQLGGGCTTIREGMGDLTSPGAWSSFSCKKGDCDDTTRLDALANAILEHQGSGDFEEATAEYLDWDAFRRFSCVSWLLWTGDDYVHNLNNVVLAEGKDGRFRFLPYSTDINAGYAWGGAYSNTELWGYASLSQGCRRDEGCREATYDTCEALIDTYEALDAPALIADLAQRLKGTPAPWGEVGQGMWRDPDDRALRHYQAFHQDRPALARLELQALREGPVDTGGSDTGVWEYDQREAGSTR